MKRFLKTVLIVIVIIFLICLTPKLGILDFSVLNVSEEKIAGYSDYYFNKLQQDEKEMYVRIDEAIKNKEEKIFLGIHDDTELTEKVSNVLTAYFYDNPECYYISNEYLISVGDIRLFKYASVQLDYTTSTDSEMDARNMQLETAIEQLLKDNITESMTDFEKEVAIHDALVKHVSYYEYEDIDSIPAIKHTAYGALVQKEAVCDGYSKAFKILLDRVGIESIIVSGTADNIAHAWNMVKLDDEYYHVDVTSNKLEDKSNKYVVHTYFNVTDEVISKTHTIDKVFTYPKSVNTKYDYYTNKGYYISYEDNLNTKLRDIVTKQKASNILEIKIDEKYNIRKIIDTLYNLNFNNWRTSGKTSVSYNQIENIYVFIK